MFPQIFGKYVLEREIAAGGMARVYLATLRGAVGFEKRLVVKQIRPELACDEGFVTRFVEEAKTAVELSHPNIVPVYELGVEQGVYYIAMELCEGLTLSEVLAETGPFGPVEGAYVGAEICRALDYAHRRARIVHRDVTPRNVLIDDEGAVRLIDFGIASPVAHGGEAAREVFGSPGHMPPEQLHGAELTPATDVFAVGVLLIEAWSGQPPFRRATAQESARALFTTPAPIDERQPLLAPLRDLIASSIALDARERPLAAEHLARPLREFLKSEDSGDIARRLGERVRKARRRARASSPWLPGEGNTAKNNENTRPVSDGLRADRESGSGSAPVTRTFAARQEVEAWTRPLSSPPPPAVGPLPTTPAMPGTRPAGGELSAPPAARSDDSAREPSGISSSKVSRAPKGASGLLLGAGSLALVVAAFAFVPRVVAPKHDAAGPLAKASSQRPEQSPRAPASAEPPRLSPSAPLVLAASSTSPSSFSSLPAASARPKVAPSPASPADSGQKSGPSHAHEAPSSAPSSAEPEQFGLLKITADPRATVEVSGPRFHQAGKSPIVGLRLPIGKYQVVFRNDTFGAPLTAQVTILAGVSRSVHADFRQAEPAVSIH